MHSVCSQTLCATFAALSRASGVMECLQADRNKAVKHFNPKFPSTSDGSLSKASSLFAAFAFQKGSEGDVPAAGGQSMEVHPYL